MSRARIAPLELVIELGKPRTWLGANVIVTSLDGWTGGGVEVRRQETPRSRRHGLFSKRGYRGGRLVTVEGIAWADSRPEAANLADQLAEVLAEGTKGMLRVLDPDLGPRWAECYLTGTPEIDWDGEQDIEFAFDVICPDARRYGDLSKISTGTRRQGGGLRFPLFSGTPHVEERRNLFTNPSFEGGIAPSASSTNGSLTHVTTGGLRGPGAARLTSTAVANLVRASLQTITVMPGQTITLSADVKPALAGRTARLMVDLNAGTTYKQAIAAPLVATPANVWTRVSQTVTIPEGIDRLLVFMRLEGGTAAGETMLIDGLLAEVSPVVGDYFDGSTAPPAGFVRSWTEEPNNSPSVLSRPAGRAGILDFGEGGSLGTVTFTNRGTAEVSPLMKVTGPTSGFTITEVETRRRLEYIGNVGRGEELWLDARTGTAKISGVQDRSTNLRRDEWPSVPGRSSRTYLFESPNDPGATLTLEASPAWW